MSAAGSSTAHPPAGWSGSPFKAAYVAPKHGIVGLTKLAALETAEEAITGNAICPGYIYMPLVEAQIDGQAKAHGISREDVIQWRVAGAATQQARNSPARTTPRTSTSVPPASDTTVSPEI